MGKRIEKAFSRDKGQSSGQDNQEDNPNKTPEPYTCTGQFSNDFHELCRRNNMINIPAVVMRPHRPPSPGSVPAPEEKTKGGKKDKMNQPPPDPEPEQEVDENGEAIDAPPKTYTVKDKFDYFRPCVQVEMDNPDKQDTVTEVYVRNWKIDEAMMDVFKHSFTKLERLHTINFWNTGLAEETVETLASFLPDCPNMRTLTLDNNPVKAENWHLFLKEDSPIQHLSLRYNRITDKGCIEMGHQLGTAKRSNQKLLSLNLNGNSITDKGAEALAQGLKMNRTLLSLGLANNKLGNHAAKKLSEALSCFALTHEEIVERRKLLSEKGSPEGQKSPSPGSRRADSRDRPGSVRSSHAGQGKGGKSAKAKKDGKGGKDEEKHDKAKGKKEQEKNPKKDTKGSKGGGLNGRASGASVVAETGKAANKKGDKGKGKKGPSLPEHETPLEPDTHEVINPLLDEVQRSENGVVTLQGNRALISLNLSYNQIEEEGIKKLLAAVDYQSIHCEREPGYQGLMRLQVHKNNVPKDNEELLKLQSVMETKDPFYKAPTMSPDQESTAT